MKVSQKQILMLYQIVLESCAIVNSLGFSQEDRQNLVNEILNQQDKEIKDYE